MTLWALIRMMERPSVKRALLLGVLGAMCVLTSWYYGLFSILGSLLILGWYFLETILAVLQYESRHQACFDIRGRCRYCCCWVQYCLFVPLYAENAIVTRDPEL